MRILPSDWRGALLDGSRAPALLSAQFAGMVPPSSGARSQKDGSVMGNTKAASLPDDVSTLVSQSPFLWVCSFQSPSGQESKDLCEDPRYGVAGVVPPLQYASAKHLHHGTLQSSWTHAFKHHFSSHIPVVQENMKRWKEQAWLISELEKKRIHNT